MRSSCHESRYTDDLEPPGLGEVLPIAITSLQNVLRSVMTLRRNVTGSTIAVIAVGAMLVGSIFYMPGVDSENAQVRRGQCLGGFKVTISLTRAERSSD